MPKSAYGVSELRECEAVRMENCEGGSSDAAYHKEEDARHDVAADGRRAVRADDALHVILGEE